MGMAKLAMIKKRETNNFRKECITHPINTDPSLPHSCHLKEISFNCGNPDNNATTPHGICQSPLVLIEENFCYHYMQTLINIWFRKFSIGRSVGCLC